jgi:hypothetical protein
LPGVLAVSLAACSTTLEPNDPIEATFVIEVSGEEFRVQTSTAAQAAALRSRLQAGTRGVIMGTLVAGNGGFNSPWSWHLDAASVHAPDVAMELCDGRPSMVSADLTYWLGSVKVYCPWGAKVVREEP